MRTTLPSTTSPCLKLLMSESCSASSSSIVVGSGPSSRARAGAGSSGSSSSPAAGASSASAASIAAVDGRRRDSGRGGLGGGGRLRRLGRLANLGCLRNLGCLGRGGRRRGLGGLVGGDGHLRGGGDGGGLIGDRDRRDGVLGGWSLGGGDGLTLRRGPTLLLVGQVRSVSFEGFRPRNHERPRALARAVWATMVWSVVGFAPRSAPSASRA